MKALALKIRQNKIFEETSQFLGKHINIQSILNLARLHSLLRFCEMCVVVSEMTAIYLRFPYVSEEDLDKILNG